MKVIIIGAGGLGREVLEIFRAWENPNIIGFIDDDKSLWGKEINGLCIMYPSDPSLQKRLSVIIAIGNNKTRRNLVNARAESIYINAIHPSVTLPDNWYNIGVDVIIGAEVILTECQISIGNHVHIDAGCILSHDVVLKDYVRLNPGVTLCGNVTIEEGAYIGAGATIKEGVRIGAWSIIGMGSVVLNDVSANAIVFGVPAR